MAADAPATRPIGKDVPNADASAPTTPIRVVVVDDHTVFRQGIAALLDAANDTTVVGQASTGGEAVSVVEEAAPDVVLMDVQMPGMNGIEATRRMLADHPDVRVVMLTMLEDDDSLFAAMCAGARSYLLKGADKDEMLATIRAAAAGEARFGPAIARRLTEFFQRADNQDLDMTPFSELTDREREVLDLIAYGLDNATIASRLFITSKTVSNHISNIFNRLRVSDRAQAIVKAREAGLGRQVGDR